MSGKRQTQEDLDTIIAEAQAKKVELTKKEDESKKRKAKLAAANKAKISAEFNARRAKTKASARAAKSILDSCLLLFSHNKAGELEHELLNAISSYQHKKKNPKKVAPKEIIKEDESKSEE